ncbi:protein-export chaperone SecB [Secundilactobacillus yichangensis]|uniref:protein-export chaperone SecB n=1 Tax=Secundilactobacillus yichangensis TaxID=2799580 RepID=UPI001941B28B|nr:protein-export chaperone SecB [Secundilactobacillus yichangensis]
MTVLNFNGYRVRKFEYSIDTNHKGESGSRIKLEPKFQAHIAKGEILNQWTVTLSMEISKKAPFYVKIVIDGSFTYNPNEDDQKIGEDNLLLTNAVAILFPYLRSTLTTITALSNEIPAVVLPTVNIAQLLKRNIQKNNK